MTAPKKKHHPSSPPKKPVAKAPKSPPSKALAKAKSKPVLSKPSKKTEPPKAKGQKPAPDKQAAQRKAAAPVNPAKVPAPKPAPAKSHVPSKAPANRTQTVKNKPAPAPTGVKSTMTKKPSKPSESESSQKKPTKEAPPAKNPVPEAEDEKTKAIVLGARKRKHTPSVFKVRKKNTPIVFTLDDVREIIEHRKEGKAPSAEKPGAAPAEKAPAAGKPTPAGKRAPEPPPPAPTPQHRVLGAASLADILGGVTLEKAAPSHESDEIPQKWRRYYKMLIELRDHVLDGLEIHTQETLKRSSKEDSGDLSGYSQHMADAGTDTFDRDFALSLVSNEQEALYEIEEAIKRIRSGAYGVCEITGQPIAAERLHAVPFTRYSLEGQQQLERNRRRNTQRGSAGVFDEAEEAGGGDEEAET